MITVKINLRFDSLDNMMNIIILKKCLKYLPDDYKIIFNFENEIYIQYKKILDESLIFDIKRFIKEIKILKQFKLLAVDFFVKIKKGDYVDEIRQEEYEHAIMYEFNKIDYAYEIQA